MCYCARHAPTPPPGCSTSGGSAKCCRASGAESFIKRLEKVSPLAVPVMLEIGRETVYGEASETVMAEAADELIKEAMG